MKKTFNTRLRDYIIIKNPFFKKRNGSRILCFHDIQNVQNFEKKIHWLNQEFKIVSLSNLLNQPAPRKVALTFDDAYQSWVSTVSPILNRYNLPATFFINSGLIGLQGIAMESFFIEKCKRSPKKLTALSHKGLQTLANNENFEIGGHTKDHYLFSKASTEEEIIHQVITDKQQLEDWTGRKLKYFAYPFGQIIHAPSSVQNIVKSSGYEKAFSIVPGFVNQSNNPYFVPRDSLELFQSNEVWHQWLHGGYDQISNLKNKIYTSFSIPYR